jgi:hypothetical protein
MLLAVAMPRSADPWKWPVRNEKVGSIRPHQGDDMDKNVEVTGAVGPSASATAGANEPLPLACTDTRTGG